MGLIDRLFQRKAQPRTTQGQWLEFLDGAGMIGSASENPYVYRCKDLRATAVSSLRPIVYDKEGNELYNHPLNQLLDRPNPRSTWRQFMYDVQIDIATTGNAYILPMTTIKGVGELWRIPPERVTYTATGDIFHPIDEWMISTGTSSISVHPDNLIHVHTQLGPDMILGISPLDAAGLSIRNQNDAREWNSSLLNNGAKPTLIVSDEHVMTMEQAQDFKSKLNLGFAGKKNAGRIMLLDGGKTASTAGFSATDMDYSNGIVLSAREIAVAFGVPPEHLGDAANKTYSNMEEGSRFFATHTVIPLADMVYEPLTAYLRRFYADFDSIGYDREQIDGMSSDGTDIIRALNDATFLTINEKRARMSYQSVEGGDVILQPLGQAPLTEVASDIDSLMDDGET